MKQRRISRWLEPLRETTGVSRWMFWSGVAIVAFFVVLAVFAPILAPYGFDQVSDAGVRFPKQGSPDGTHLFGTTVGNYDVLSRVIWGARTAIEVVLLAVVFSLAIGVPLGLFSGYVGGRADRVLVLIMDALFAFPYILLAIVIAFLLSDKLGQGVVTAAVAITAVYVPQYFRVVRNHVISVREEPYVEAAVSAGTPALKRLYRHILPNTVAPLIVQGTYICAFAMLLEAILSFLGVGLPPEIPTWGNIMAEGRLQFNEYPHSVLFPGLFLAFTVLSVNMLGDGLRDTLDPHFGKRGDRP